MNICLFPGTFDPITLGHVDIIKRGLTLFDQIVIGIGINSSKQPMFSLEQRIAWIEEIFKDEPKVKVATYEGLTIAYCKEIKANFILRGIRSATDFEYERGIADVNRFMEPDVETIILTSAPLYATISSTLVREVIKYKGDTTCLLPKEITFK